MMYARLTTGPIFGAIFDVPNVGSYEGRSHRRLTAREKVARDAEIVADWISGLGWEALAVKHGLRQRQCHNIVRDWQADRGRHDEMQERGSFGSDPLEMVEEFLWRFAAVERQLAQLAATADNDNARVGAQRARMDAISRQVDLLQAVGRLPRHLGSLLVEADVRLSAERIVAVFERYEVAEEIRQAVIAALPAGTS